jgi:hypothetical protein
MIIILRKKLSLEKITKEVNGKKYIAYIFCIDNGKCEND